MTTQRQKCERFAELHAASEAFVMPNPWDVGSARILQGLGFAAIATTSAAFANAVGKSDGQVTLEEKLLHCRELVAATEVPVNADFEDGFAERPEEVAANVAKVIATGVAGCSIEDFSREGHELYEFDLAVERVAAAAEVVAALDMPFQLTARAENLLRGVADLDEALRRLQAYEAVGADVLYAPAICSLEDLSTVTAELGKPVNALAMFFGGAGVAELSDAGARRISVGSALFLATANPLLAAGREMLERGTFEWAANAASGAEISRLLS